MSAAVVFALWAAAVTLGVIIVAVIALIDLVERHRARRQMRAAQQAASARLQRLRQRAVTLQSRAPGPRQREAHIPGLPSWDPTPEEVEES